MNIVHYILGIPPVRGGGLIKYAIDLAEEQSKIGHNVCILYPGCIKKRNIQRIRKKKKDKNLIYFEIINPLPVSMAGGMCNTDLFMQKADKKVYVHFFEKQNTEVLHIHSLMGLHLELVEAAKEKGIKIIFTSHDYFGICPKSNLLCGDHICDDITWKHCNQCCSKPDPYKVLVRRQSEWFELYAKSSVLLKFIQRVKRRLKLTNRGNVISVNTNMHFNFQNDYLELRIYYEKIFELIDCMHYNSILAKQMYDRAIGERNNVVLQVLHSGIVDKRKKRICSEQLRFGFLGNAEQYKGFPMLCEVLDSLWRSKKNSFVLDVYFDEAEKREYIRKHTRYSYAEVDEVFANMDVLLVPSMWAETYGFVVVEAIMHGVPVIASENVGAQDFILKLGKVGKIVQADKDAWIETLEKLIEKPYEITRMSEQICNCEVTIDYRMYCQKILDVYKTL